MCGGGVWLGIPRVQVTGSERNGGEFNENRNNSPSQPKKMTNARPRGLGIWYTTVYSPVNNVLSKLEYFHYPKHRAGLQPGGFSLPVAWVASNL